jgi:hypothetical protein
MDRSISDIASGLRAAAIKSPEAYTDYLGPLWAETLMGQHEPATPALDGPKTRQRQLELHRAEDQALRKAMPDYRLDDVSMAVKGNKVELSAIIAGTPSKGARMTIPVRWVFTFNDQHIDHVLTVVDMEVARPSLEVLRAARLLPG